MRDIENKSYPKPYTTGSAQKRRREANDKVNHRRRSRHKSKTTWEKENGCRVKNLLSRIGEIK